MTFSILTDYLHRRRRWHPLLPAVALAALTALPAMAQQRHPHLLVTDSDKQTILEKIQTAPWAGAIYHSMLKEVTPYVTRHQADPEWILSRYLMNRIPGKRYTEFYSDPGGARLTGYGGDAPVPTVRVSPNKRGPITADGHSYRLPRMDELIPYDTSMQMRLQRNAPDSGWVVTDPKSFVSAINGRINELALKSAIIYWLTGKAPYAKFAADILNQWAKGAYYQMPIVGPCRTGFLDIQTLGDAHEVPLILAYDFLHNYMGTQGYDLKPYQTVFDRIAATMTFRGFVNNNWFSAQTPAMVTAALSLDDTARRNYYLNFYLHKDTIQGGCGHLAIPSMISRWLTPDGHWKETAGYHNYATGSFLISALIMEKNGYPIFSRYPELFQASYVLLKYAFPNLKNPAFGDNGGRPSENPKSLEIALVMAQHQKDTALRDRLEDAMQQLLDAGYNRSSSGYLGLLSFLAEIPKPASRPAPWPRSGELNYAALYLQRNGTDREHGLMYVVQGATYNHNHANGMAMEIYGAGKVMGPDPGDGLNYDAPLHIRYYAEWAAHNTVVTDGISAPIPRFKGGGGSKHMGRISLAAMEPAPGAPALSPYCSFTVTRYNDMTTRAPEERTLAIVRLNDTAGYYVDVYRSAGRKTNDYLYHNIGDTAILLNADRQPLLAHPAVFPPAEAADDPSGFSAIKDYRSTGKVDGPVTALFRVNEKGNPPAFMQVMMPGTSGRVYWTAQAPATKTAGRSFARKPTPILIVHQEGTAWKRPFVAVYEPYRGEGAFTTGEVTLVPGADTGDFTAIRVGQPELGSHQFIFQSSDTTRAFHAGDATFRGRFAVAAFRRDGKLRYLYLGRGRRLSYQGYSIETNESNPISGNLEISGDTLSVSGSGRLRITLPAGDIIHVRLSTAKTAGNPLPLTRRGDAISFTVPAAQGGTITLIRSSKTPNR